MRLSGDLCFFMQLLISREDRFSIEIAWSHSGHFPSICDTFFSKDDPAYGGQRYTRPKTQCRFRIGELLTPPQDHWWYVLPKKSIEDLIREMDEICIQGFAKEPSLEEAQQKIPGLVSDAVHFIVTHAVPYLKETAAGLGSSFPDPAASERHRGPP
jgi:hypothetical protein